MLRSEVGRNITARLTPSLEFVLDALPETSAHLEDLLAKARGLYRWRKDVIRRTLNERN
jgi:ribosome-binding factor A